MDINHDEPQECGMCSQSFMIADHPDGLSLDGGHFVCSDCCASNQSPVIMQYVKRVSETMRVRPIFLLLQELKRR